MRKSTQKGKIEPLFSLSSIGNRAWRWRQENGVVSWTQRSGSDNLRNYIIALLSEEGRKSNTTRDLVNGLTKAQREEARKPNKGVHMNRAGARLISDEARRAKSKKPNKRTTKRMVPDEFDDDVDVENIHNSQRLKTKVSDRKGKKTIDARRRPAGNAPTKRALATLKSQKTNQSRKSTIYGHPGKLPFFQGFVDNSQQPVIPQITISDHAHEGGALQLIPPAYSNNGYPQCAQPVEDCPSLEQVGLRGGIRCPHGGSAANNNTSDLVKSLPYPSAHTSLLGLLDPELEIMGEQDFEGMTLPSIILGDLAATAPDQFPSLKRNRESDEQDEGDESRSGLRKKNRHRVKQSEQQPVTRSLQRVLTPHSRRLTPQRSMTPIENTACSIAKPSPEVQSSANKSGIDKLVSSGNTTTATTPHSINVAQTEAAEDFRFKEPQTYEEAEHLDAALVVTRNDFESYFAIFGEQAPQTDFYDSYAKQYAALQQELSLRWPGEAENLEHLSAWSGGFDKWTSAEVTDDIFAEDLWKTDRSENVGPGTNIFEESL